MADFRLCSIEDCGKLSVTRGWCEAHYRRWRRYGDPTAGHAPRGALVKFFEETVLPYQGDDCLFWPYSAVRGYATVSLDGKMRYVSRLVCEDEHGPAPTPEHEAAHSCGKGHLGCVARRHLSWKTSAENTADKFVHGTIPRGESHPSSKLTDADVAEIIALRGQVSQVELAKRFGVCRSNIGMVQNKRRRA